MAPDRQIVCLRKPTRRQHGREKSGYTGIGGFAMGHSPTMHLEGMRLLRIAAA